MRSVYKYWSGLVVAMVVTQVGLSGYGAFFVAGKVDDKIPVTENVFEEGVVFHAVFGYVVVLSGVVLLLLAPLAKVGKRRTYHV